MKLWLDDCRPAPDGWTLATTAADAIVHLATGTVVECSLDHDLAWDHYESAMAAYRDDGTIDYSAFHEPTGYDMVLWMAEHNVWPAIVRVHSMNPVGAAAMRSAIERYKP